MSKVTVQSEQSAKVLLDKEGECLTAALRPEQCGLGILKVPGISGYAEKTTVTKVLEHIRGTKNLTGLVIPVAEVRDMFNMGAITRH